MRFVIFGGTTEARELSRLLAQKGGSVLVSVATDYGREEQGEYPGVQVVVGRRTAREMEELLADCVLCVDATHPYAQEVTANIRTACERGKVPYRRLLRAESSRREGLVVSNGVEAAAFLEKREGNVLLTTGTKELSAFDRLDRGRLYVRVLPSREGIAACEERGIPHRNIIAMQGPFSKELNAALLRQFSIRYLVTKDSGGLGGFLEKAEAARDTGAVLVVLRRPEEQGMDLMSILGECMRYLP